MPSTYQRSFLKGVCWETISLIITFIAVYLVYGDLELSIKFSVGLSAVKILIFFAHERIWKKIGWGKY
jgi:adenylylsulfate kinase